jgi:hypothetical protein
MRRVGRPCAPTAMTPAAPMTAGRIRSACVQASGAILAVEGVEPT